MSWHVSCKCHNFFLFLTSKAIKLLANKFFPGLDIPTKFGFGLDQIEQAIIDAKKLKNIRIIGLMGLATFTNNTEQIKTEFYV